MSSPSCSAANWSSEMLLRKVGCPGCGAPVRKHCPAWWLPSTPGWDMPQKLVKCCRCCASRSRYGLEASPVFGKKNWGIIPSGTWIARSLLGGCFSAARPMQGRARHAPAARRKCRRERPVWERGWIIFRLWRWFFGLRLDCRGCALVAARTRRRAGRAVLHQGSALGGTGRLGFHGQRISGWSSGLLPTACTSARRRYPPALVLSTMRRISARSA